MKKSYKQAFFSGRKTEERFSDIAKSRGYSVIKTDSKTDVRLHIDLYMMKDEDVLGVDVKGKNLVNQIWCEFKNVAGDRGWMYGEADIIAFDMTEMDGFCLVDRTDLVNFCEEEVEDKIVYSKSQAYRKKYQRYERKDQITPLDIGDLKSLSSYRFWGYLD